MTGADATHRVYLHVGSAKTGTTYLQGLLWHHRAALREGGIDYVAEAPGEHFLAAIDLRDVPFAGARRPAAKGKWAAVAGRARDAEGTAVISHEVFAPTPADVAARAIADLAPAEVHLVLTTRDLLRQVTADWQERIKHGGRITFAEYVDTVLDPETTRTARRNGDPLSSFWQAQDAADVLGRWATTVPPAHVHVVTVPPPGSPRQLLWERFTTALGIDPGVYGDEGVTRDNTSLGRAETELLRRVNVALDGRLKMPAYGRIAKDRLAHTVLSARRTSPRLVLPAELREPIAAQATEIVATLRARGYDVVGDLDDLLPDPSGGTADSTADGTADQDPDGATNDEVADAGVDAVAGLLLELAAERDRLREARQSARADSGGHHDERDEHHDEQPHEHGDAATTADDDSSPTLLHRAARRATGRLRGDS